MIGKLPTSLEINGVCYTIRSDYRVALIIFQAYDDPELTIEEKCITCIRCLYENPIPRADLVEALKAATWFLDGGDIPTTDTHVKTFDWEQDEKMIFSEINKVAGFEVRSADYLHWWTFLGYFCGIGEGMLSTIMNIRSKKAKGKKFEKWEEEFIREHYGMIAFKQKLTKEEQQELDFVNSLFE